MALDYRFRLSQPGEQLGIAIHCLEDRTLKMAAAQVARAQPFTDRNLLRTFLRMPLMTFKVIAGIHFEAARLWLKGLRIVKRPRPSTGTTDTANARSYGTR